MCATKLEGGRGFIHKTLRKDMGRDKRANKNKQMTIICVTEMSQGNQLICVLAKKFNFEKLVL